MGIVKLYPTEGTHWVLYMNENFFDSCGCSPPQKLSKIIMKRNGHCLRSKYKIQGFIKKNSYWASFFLYVLFLTKVLGIDFKSAILNLYYQMIK